jgi:predicted  nucleic acid-binding Zn-ribbon protein
VQPGGQAAPTPTLNTEMVDELKRVVTKRISPFTTLEEKAVAMATAIPDETMRTRAAFSILAAEGRPVNDIIKAIDMHVVDIDGEQNRFAAAVNSAKTSKSSTIRSEIANLEKTIVSDQDLVQRLQQQINDAVGRVVVNQQQVTEKNAAVTAVEADFDSKIVQFTAAAEAVKASLIARKNVLSSILS